MSCSIGTRIESLFFISVEEDPDVARVVERNNSQMFNKSDIYPQKSQAKKFLMKELARRNILNGGPVMKTKKWDVKK